MNDKLATIGNQQGIQKHDPEMEFVVKWLCPGTSVEEVRMYCIMAKAMNLDPRKGQCYFIVGGKGENKKFNLYTSSQQVRMLVITSGKMAIEEGPFWAAIPPKGEDPEWLRYWGEKTDKGQLTIPGLCMIRHRRTDTDLVFETVRYFREVKQTYKNSGDLSGNWATSPLEQFERVTRRKAYNNNFFDVVAGVGAYEDMADDIRELDEAGEPVEVIDLSGDVDLHDRFDKLGWSDEKRKQFLQEYGDNKAAALHKLDQHSAVASKPSTKAEIPPVEEPEVQCDITEPNNAGGQAPWNVEQQPDPSKLDLDGEV